LTEMQSCCYTWSPACLWQESNKRFLYRFW